MRASGAIRGLLPGKFSDLALDEFDDGFDEVLESGRRVGRQAFAEPPAGADDQRAEQGTDDHGIDMQRPETDGDVGDWIAVAPTKIGKVMLDILNRARAGGVFLCAQIPNPIFFFEIFMSAHPGA